MQLAPISLPWEVIGSGCALGVFGSRLGISFAFPFLAVDGFLTTGRCCVHQEVLLYASMIQPLNSLKFRLRVFRILMGCFIDKNVSQSIERRSLYNYSRIFSV